MLGLVQQDTSGELGKTILDVEVEAIAKISVFRLSIKADLT